MKRELKLNLASIVKATLFEKNGRKERKDLKTIIAIIVVLIIERIIITRVIEVKAVQPQIQVLDPNPTTILTKKAANKMVIMVIIPYI